MKKKYDPEKLLARYRNGSCTPQERALVESWHLQELRKKLDEPDVEEMQVAKKRMWQQVAEQTTPIKRLNYQWLYYAAGILVFMGLGVWLWRGTTDGLPAAANYAVTKNKPILPGGNKAVLTLANGKQLLLDGSLTGIVAYQGQTTIIKNADGSIQYQNTRNAAQPAFNTITIPRGGTYSLILGDGTKVWLNSASTMRYPTAFTGPVREVQISGEAYFEVAKNKAKPFVVHMADQKIQVLGTHFNVHAYQEEKQSETTLLEGKILITKGRQTEVLKPGQQAISPAGALVKVISVPDAEDAIAWKNGFFTSSHESIYSVMNKISRWYDVDIEYRGNVEGKSFGGTISKFESVKDVLDIIESTGSVHFKIEERRIIVMP